MCVVVRSENAIIYPTKKRQKARKRPKKREEERERMNG